MIEFNKITTGYPKPAPVEAFPKPSFGARIRAAQAIHSHIIPEGDLSQYEWTVENGEDSEELEEELPQDPWEKNSEDFQTAMQIPVEFVDSSSVSSRSGSGQESPVNAEDSTEEDERIIMEKVWLP